jgi:molybdopterin-guanine dinucleotide biosynthesis protein A
MVSRFFERFRRRGREGQSPESAAPTSDLSPPDRHVLAVVYANTPMSQLESEGLDPGKMAERVVAVMKSVGDDVLAVGRPGTLAGIASVPMYRKGSKSPLTAIVTALKAATDLTPPGVYPQVVFVGVDQPFVRPETLRFLLAFGGSDHAVVPINEEGERQPSCAVYPSAWYRRLRVMDESKLTVEQALENSQVREIGPDRWRVWGEDGRSWFKANSVAQLREGEERFG